MQEKDRYTLEELYDNLRISLTKLAKMAEINEGTLIRIRKGKYSVRRTTINRLLDAFSEIYGLKLSLDNVTGFVLEDKRHNDVTEQAPTLSISTPTIPAIPTTEVPQNRIVERKTQPIPDNLPEGTIKLVDFKKKYGIADASMHRWINDGINGEKVETVTRPKPTGIGPQHYLTPDQQEKAVEILKRHGKLK